MTPMAWSNGRRRFRKVCVVTAAAFITIVTASCQSHPPSSLGTSWRIPSDLQTFGSPSPGSIQIAVFGYAVKRPGYYHLPQGATVHDAIQAAQGLGNIVGWRRPYSGIQRHKADGSIETIWFTRSGRATEEQMLPCDGDTLHISHEVY